MGGTRGGIGGSRRSGARARLGRALRRSYRWVLREAETRTGAAAMVALSFTGSAFVPIFLEPPLILLTSGLPNLWRRFALLFAAGSVLGGVATYVIGYAFVETVGLAVIRFWGAEASWAHLMELAQARAPTSSLRWPPARPRCPSWRSSGSSRPGARFASSRSRG
jgi:hypothetical protein